MRKIVTLFTMLMLVCILAIAQSRPITGRVVDEGGQPVAGASITIKGTTTGVSANANGDFTIDAKTGDVLVVSAVGIPSREITIGSGSSIMVNMARESQSLAEVVVTAQGVRRQERSLGYSVSKVDPSALVQKSEPDMLKGMQGKVAGVDIRSGQGMPGAATRIQIRGNNSFTGNTQPLIIVDGIPYSNDQVTTSSQTTGGTGYSSGIANLDPNDIASMNVLKGSAAAALYGSRASNGVVVITTKSGTAARSRKGMEVNFRSSYSIEKIANLPNYQNKFGAGANGAYSNSNGSWGPAFDDLDSIPAWPTYKAAYPELFPSANIAYKAYPNNVKSLFKTGKVLENSVGFTGGDEKASMALTASHLNHEGYVENSKYDRYNVGLGGSTKLAMGLNLRANLSYTRSTQRGGYFGENQVDGAASLFARTLFLARNWDTDLPYEDKQGNPLTWNGGSQFDHPRWSALNNVARTSEERYIAGFHADFNFNSWARLDYNLGTNINSLGRREVTEIGSRAAEGNGRLIVDNYRKQEIESNLMVTFTPTLPNDLTLRFVVGNNFNQRTTTRQAVTGSKFIEKGIHTLSNTSQQVFNQDYYERRRIIGLFAEANLGYKNYLFLNLTGRNDWSSTLPIANRSYFYPSISTSFIFTDAIGLQSNILDYGKIRAGWARVGRDAEPYSLEDVFVFGTNFLSQPTAGRSATVYDQNLTPEFTSEIELGTQLGFLKRRIELDFTWYNRTSTNLIAPIQVPTSSGYSSLYTNFGKISNKGIEIDLTLRPVKARNFSWEIRGAFTRNKNMVEELTPGVESFPLSAILTGISPYFEAGQPYGYLRGTKSMRDDEGNLLINPATGGMIEDTEEGFVGDPNPDYKLGITNTFTYKGAFLSALFDMTKGGDMYSVTVTSLLGRGVTRDTEDRETTWVIPGVYGDPNTGMPILSGGKKVQNVTRITTNDLYFSPNPTTGATFGINTPTEWNIYDATVYRLREVTLGYEIPKTLFKKLPIGAMSISFSGRNLWYLAPNFPKHTRFDPEVNSFGATNVQGIELSAAPTTKRYGVNLNVTF